jgi:small subunit ribosomal protein S20
LTQSPAIRRLNTCGDAANIRLPPALYIPAIAGPEKSLDFMANHVSSLKRARQTETKTVANRANRTKFRSSLRSLREAIAAGDRQGVAAAYSATVSVLDKSVQKGVLHKNTASRYKSRLNARVKALVTGKTAA